ncbi:TetR/AcrR family transcriptional regulator [Pedobacter cryoconitis]|uniref:AcrR family transcriptional regulator n=1 Tax=Pedobacter cryoconitis TaxID=188932 RepID=A0A7X0J1S8_9SPHI|nr:TetR/AcrR family transcriptional regulator [Pedobacter cryoconitis]MBB6499529.1 AcrR family transcriptional regulator [Pedobacter cryoconitis]
MGIAERKERVREEMKQMITTAAMKMFLEEGYAKTSIRNIADSIEYSPGTIYLYYKDKDELLYEVQRQAYGKLLEAFKAGAVSKDPLERLEQLGKLYVAFGLDNPELYDLMFIIRAPMNVDEKLHQSNGGDTFAFLVQCLEECMKGNLLIFKDIQLAALQIWSMVHGLVSLNLRCRLKIMVPVDEDIRFTLFRAVEEYLEAIRA